MYNSDSDSDSTVKFLNKRLSYKEIQKTEDLNPYLIKDVTHYPM